MHKYLYNFKYDHHYQELCYLEARQVFGQEPVGKVLFSDIQFHPSKNPFAKNQLQLLSSAKNYEDLLKCIENLEVLKENFKVEYLILEGDPTPFNERRQKQNDIGHRITGEPNFFDPKTTFGIATFQDSWYFGILTQHAATWQKHKEKPQSFSNSINMNIAKTLVNIASRGNTEIKLLDACCGVGTIMLEACISAYQMDACDINWKACKNTRENLAFYHYSATVYRMDIKDLHKTYDAAIVDLPYNLTTYSDDEITANILNSCAKIAKRIVIVSITNIKAIIEQAGLTIADYCTVEKSGKSNFERKIWVCEVTKT